MARIKMQDKYTFAKVINGEKKRKSITRLHPDRLGDLGPSMVKQTIYDQTERVCSAMAGVTAGDTIPVYDGESSETAVPFVINRELLVTDPS